MQQATGHSEMIYSHANGDSVNWGDTMGPMGPLAMFGLNPNFSTPIATPNQGRRAVRPSAGPSVEPRVEQQTPRSGGARGQEEPRPPSSDTQGQEETVRELLRASGLDETRVGWLIEEGFSSRKALSMLTPEAVNVLISHRSDKGPVPLAQILALNSVASKGREAATGSRGNEAPQNPRQGNGPFQNPRQLSWSQMGPVHQGQHPPQFPDVGTMELLRRLFGTDRAPQPQAENRRRMDFDDPTTMLRMQGKQVQYYDVTEYIPGSVVERERMPLGGGGEGGIILETGPKRPALHKVTINQWNSANAKILDILIMDNALTIDSIPDYLALYS